MVTWQVFRISTETSVVFRPKDEKRRVVCVFPTCNFFMEYDPRFSVAPFQLRPGDTPESAQPAHLHFRTKRYNAVLSSRTTRVRVPLARNPSPLQYPTLHFHCSSVRSLLRQPRSALEAGPSEARAISFVHTPRPHLHPKGFTFSLDCVAALTKGIMGNHELG